MFLNRKVVGILSFLIASVVEATPKSTIAVTVLDSISLPVAVATVIVEGPGGSHSGITNVHGFVDFYVPSGEYEVRILTHSSYISRSGKLFIPDSSTAAITFRVLFIDSTGDPQLSIKFEPLAVPGSGAVAVIRYVEKKKTEKSLTYSGPGLEIGIGRLMVRGAVMDCTREHFKCRIDGPVKFDLDGMTFNAMSIVIEPRGVRSGRVVALLRHGKKEIAFEELLGVPKTTKRQNR